MIEVRLTAAGQNILGSEWAALDLPADFTLQMGKDVLELNDVNSFRTEYVLPFEVDQTTVNDLILVQYDSPLTLDNRYEGLDCRGIFDGMSLKFDKIHFVRKTDKKWQLEFRRSVKSWAELASEKKLNTIESGTVSLDLTTVTDGWDAPTYTEGEIPFRFIPADYGNWVDLTEPIQFTDPTEKGIFLEDLRPFVSPVFLLKQGFCEIGYTLEGIIFETTYVKQWYDYILKRNYYSESRGGMYKVILRKGVGDNFILGGSNYFAILETSVDYDPGSIARNWQPSDPDYGAGLENPFLYKARFKFCFSGTFQASGDGPTTIKFQVEEFTTVQTFNVLVENAFEFSMTANEVRNISFCVDVDLEVGQKAFITMSEWNENNGNTTLFGGHRFIGEPNMKSLVRGDVVEFKNLVHPDYDLLSYFKGFVHKVSGQIEVDEIQNIIRVHPFRKANVYGESVPGFIIDSELIDVRDQQICNSEVTYPIKPTLNRYTRFQFADAKDSYIDKLDPLEPPFSRKLLNGIDLPNEITELKNPFFEPTLERQNALLKQRFIVPLGYYAPRPFLPVLTDNDSNERSFIIGPRTLFFAGRIGQLVSESPGDLRTNFFFEDKDNADYVSLVPWAGHQMTFKKDPDNLPALDATLVYGSDQSDLFVTFYLGATVTQKRGMFLELLLFMSPRDYTSWNFRIPFLINYLGRSVVARLQAITDFQVNKDIPTPVRCFIEPMDTECCDLPCSCQFSDCRYFSDFGTYIQQETLDDLQITSFKVDDKELLTAPVGFGLINIIQQGNGLYVTNLVDALQSLGIPYFTFSYSPDIYDPKDQPRYFRIKRPLCQTFEIIISDSGGEVYKYTDISQEQQWFSGSWQPFGYGMDTVDEPEDCQITMEY